MQNICPCSLGGRHSREVTQPRSPSEWEALVVGCPHFIRGWSCPALGSCAWNVFCAHCRRRRSSQAQPTGGALLLAGEAFAFCSLSPSILPPLYCSPLASSSPVLTPYPVTRWENGGPEDLRAPMPCTQGTVLSGAPHVLTAVCGLCQASRQPASTPEAAGQSCRPSGLGTAVAGSQRGELAGKMAVRCVGPTVAAGAWALLSALS